MRRYIRIVTAGAALCLALVFSAAKCTEHETLQQNDDGSWTLYGEFHNTSDVWASGVVLGGKLLDAEGNVIATSDEAYNCPGALPPGEFVAFELHFPATPGKQPASWVVGATSGTTHDAALPDPQMSLVQPAVERAGQDLRVTGTLRNSSNRTYEYYPFMCVALYDAAGAMIGSLELIPLEGFGESESIEPGGSVELDAVVTGDGYERATAARFWIQDPLAEAYEGIAIGVSMSELVPIE